MTTPAQYPYDTRLNVLFEQMQAIDEKELADSAPSKWYNQTLCRVNDSVVRLGVIEGEYHWHKHDSDDEFFYVVEGKLLIDLEGRIVELGPRQGFVVSRGVMHRTRAPKRTVILMVENAGIVPTGDKCRQNLPSGCLRQLSVLEPCTHGRLTRMSLCSYNLACKRQKARPACG